MSKAQVATGHFRGTAAVVNVSIGFIPDMLILNNFTDGDYLHFSWPQHRIIAFTGQSEAVAAGDKIIGATSGATATILEYHLDTGTVAGGDGAGWLVLDALSETDLPVFAAEAGYVAGSGTLDDLTLAASSVDGEAIALAAAGDTTVTAYKGTSLLSQGFTVAAATSEDAKLFTYTAIRNHDS